MARRLLVAREALRHVDVTHDAGGFVPALGRIFQDGGRSKGVVVVSMAVDDETNGGVGELAHLRHDARPIGEEAGIDDRDAILTEHDGTVSEAGQDVDAVGHLLQIT